MVWISVPSNEFSMKLLALTRTFCSWVSKRAMLTPGRLRAMSAGSAEMKGIVKHMGRVGRTSLGLG